MIPCTIQEICAAVGGTLLQDSPAAITGVTTDSRAVSAGQLFIPLTGERFDGHAYIDMALQKGAAGCLCAKIPENLQPGKFYIAVDDTEAALDEYARANPDVQHPERAAMGDEVTLDFEGFVDGVPFEGGKGEQYPLLGSGSFIPGFEEQVAGAAVGEERDVKVTFPTEYVPELAGKDAVFHIKVHQITRRAMPEWDDDFARRQGFADVSALRRAVMETAVQKKQAQAAEQFANDLIRQVTEAMTVTIPAAMVENQLDGLINELRGHLQTQGVSLEQYLEMGNTTMEQLRDHAREQAAAAARYELAMTEIARREGIDITEADVDAKYAELSKQYGLSVELLRQQLPPLRLRHDLKLAAAQAVVVDSANRR